MFDSGGDRVFYLRRCLGKKSRMNIPPELIDLRSIFSGRDVVGDRNHSGTPRWKECGHV